MIYAACHLMSDTHPSDAGGTFSGAAIRATETTDPLPRPPFTERAKSDAPTTCALPARPFLIGGQPPVAVHMPFAADHLFTDPGHSDYASQSNSARITFSRGAARSRMLPISILPLRTLSRRRAIRELRPMTGTPAATHDTQGVINGH